MLFSQIRYKRPKLRTDAEILTEPLKTVYHELPMCKSTQCHASHVQLITQKCLFGSLSHRKAMMTCSL